MKVRIILFFFYLFIFSNSFSQRMVNVEVSLPAEIDLSQLHIQFENGNCIKTINPEKQGRNFTLSDTIWSRYGTLSFSYPDSTETNGMPVYYYWINNNQAKISFNKTKASINPFKNAELFNAHSLSNNEFSEYLQYIQKELTDFKNFYLNNHKHFGDNPSLNDSLNAKHKLLEDKALDYISANSLKYSSLWIFNKKFALGGLNAVHALDFYNNTFPDSLKNTFTGKKIRKRLEARISTKPGSSAPKFKTTTVLGDTINLSDFYNKYVLLDFWASWCKPCKKLVPQLQDIKKQYSNKELVLISISLDKSKTAFQKALKENTTGWLQVNDPSFAEAYAIGPIPQIILIDKTGTVIYNMETFNDYSLERLHEFLKTIF